MSTRGHDGKPAISFLENSCCTSSAGVNFVARSLRMGSWCACRKRQMSGAWGTLFLCDRAVRFVRMQSLADTTALSSMLGSMLRTRMVRHTIHSWRAPGALHPWPQCPCSGAKRFLVGRRATCREGLRCPGDSIPGYAARSEQISSANFSGVSRGETYRGLPLRVSSSSKNHPVSATRRRRCHGAVCGEEA